MKAKLRKAFPHASELMVAMALDTTKFNEQKARGVLGMLQGGEDKAAKGSGKIALT